MAAPTMDIDYFMALLNAEFAMDRWEHNSEFILDALNYVYVLDFLNPAATGVVFWYI